MEEVRFLYSLNDKIPHTHTEQNRTEKQKIDGMMQQEKAT